MRNMNWDSVENMQYCIHAYVYIGRVYTDSLALYKSSMKPVVAQNDSLEFGMREIKDVTGCGVFFFVCVFYF